ncbi:MAG: phosphoglycerate kinase [Marinilabiliales bacterium]|nr:MAG: phosphoglycerate kinase [Marinilabiliales bacterium]
MKETYSVDDYNFKNKRVLIRVDFNVPLNDKGEITDKTRIVTALPTIRKIIADGGSVVLLSHLGRPKGKHLEDLSFKRILPQMTEIVGMPIKFSEDCVGDKAIRSAEALEPGEILLLENLRFHQEEIEGSEQFAEELSKLGDVYIMEAFGTAHRDHASTSTIARFFPGNKMLGYLVESEIRNIDKLLNQGNKPFTAILGGSKVSTKIHIIEALLEKVDNLIIGGGLTYTFSKALGGEIGDSLIEEDYIPIALKIIETAKKNGVKLYMPIDCIIADEFNNDANIGHCEIDKIPVGWQGMGIGIKTAELFTKIIEDSSTILWNGPMGVFEMPHFAMGTLKIALAVSRATDKGAYSLVGGGDSIAALNKFSLYHKVSYVSTAGGALLEYIEGKELPSLKAIRERN